MNGSLTNVPKLAILSPTASATACSWVVRVTSDSDGSSWFVRMRE